MYFCRCHCCWTYNNFEVLLLWITAAIREANPYLNIISKCIPKTALPRRRNLPWINSDILRAIKRRNSLLRAYKRSGSPFKLQQYKCARNRIVTEVRKAKLLFFDHLHSVDAKTFWKLFKLLTRKQSSIPVLLAPNSGPVSDDVQKANLLNNQFFSNFNHSVPSFNPPGH